MKEFYYDDSVERGEQATRAGKTLSVQPFTTAYQFNDAGQVEFESGILHFTIELLR